MYPKTPVVPELQVSHNAAPAVAHEEQLGEHDKQANVTDDKFEDVVVKIYPAVQPAQLFAVVEPSLT